jgi:hypothetical protein
MQLIKFEISAIHISNTVYRIQHSQCVVEYKLEVKTKE